MRHVKLNKSEEAKLRARELRSNMSVSEKWFWAAVRKDLLGVRFRRQVAIGPYFLDFYVPSAKLCIEIDGEQHALQADYDRQRDEYLAQFGIMTLRIPSIDLFYREQDRYSAWIREVEKLCRQRADSPPPTPSLSPERKEGAPEPETLRGGCRPTGGRTH